ncbi:probable serine/threonine-protein kinase At1g54610 isoform X2 [Arachis ipaensis]|uniref:Protein kinase domain-containing protein n=1 Tax=Arachis hypogaea TaxID=3818 RepID=A0A444X8D3_ARAHY|nr:probable serine/threonine-protein kinase At1g54610 isoform X2 [Arachis ipaensis]XP_025685968.1 protein IMPAIRED IN BABA-INDUCED STERILITY 1-like [Arachis hypogaea]QHN83627.1 putative serine/threonine-protein kinase [Arachis hypogaea]RYQ85948.1 hypothetical protein Ahy_B10g105593 [Arachis hypogaea]
MGCINSKNAVSGDSSPYLSPVDHVILEPLPPPAVSVAGSRGHSHVAGSSLADENKKKLKKNASKKSNGSFSIRLGFSKRHVDAEHNAAGWPSWLTVTAGEAVHGWLPLRADSFQKLDKIGQGTYSSVFRAREVETGRMFALKKVRFDNLQPESIRFMAREISILRRLDHPNIMKLEGIITSKQSSSIYLVFEYMEHDLAGLVSRPDILFTDSQIKCYLRQLLSGIEHCHIRGIMHRDIKVSNILLNNEGILKIGDFGLANTISPNNKHQLTSRVVTLWYRPPELLMGSTNYGVSVDLWSVGCVFAELFLGKPILKGRTEVEQLHKIFKLCGSPPDDFWKKYKLPHATVFKPQTTYESSLRERCAEFPETAVDLLETLLSIDPANRGTASSALMSEYFNTKPYACNPSNLPKYSPSKELDAKSREDMSRKRTDDKMQMRDAATSRRQPRRVKKYLREPIDHTQSVSKENGPHNVRRSDGRSHIQKGIGGHKDHLHPEMDAVSDLSQMVNIADGNGFTVPAQGGYDWVKRRKQDASSTLSDGSRSKISALDPNFAKGTYDLNRQRMTALDKRYNDKQGYHEETRVTMDFDPSELLNHQGNTDHGSQVSDMRREVRKSRFGREI